VRPLLAIFEDLTPADRATDLTELRGDEDEWIRDVCAFATVRL